MNNEPMTEDEYAVHLAFDLENYGFDGVSINPIDAGLILARYIRKVSEAK